ncbi:hypothetical protein [Falsiphaeobacter marinintestinus]|uniref:hypothetical protein n=1 Tax=Falsiphaeobacter marinintestinus TaxID=1492905 RepID=UPI0011B66193|nr:hypothetical protein [Phaeobacter marinintestinus]
MALILIAFGSFIGFGVALVQCLVMEASALEGLTTYFAFGFGLPITVGLAKWSQIKLRHLFQTSPLLGVQRADS